MTSMSSGGETAPRGGAVSGGLVGAGGRWPRLRCSMRVGTEHSTRPSASGNTPREAAGCHAPWRGAARS